MTHMVEVLERADVLMSSQTGISTIELPALREVMENVVLIKESKFGYSKHSDHSKSSTKGCAMGCLGG